MHLITLPEQCKPVGVATPQAANGFSLSDYISCKNAHKIWFYIHHYSGGGDTDLVVGLKEATAVAGTGAAAVTATVPIWSDSDHGTTSDGLARQTDAASYTIDTGAGTDYLVVIEWDPVLHTAGYDCIAVTGSGGNASNIVAITAHILERYPADPPPSAIID